MSSDEGKILNGMNDKDLEKILAEISNLKVPPSPKGKDKTWGDILHSIEKGEEKRARVVSLNTSKVWYSIAASVVVLFVIGFLIRQNATITIEVAKGDFTSIILPDNSEVKINADSRVEYKRFGWKNNRHVLLSGEAYFAVTSGNQFTVDAGAGKKVTVKGTQFNVFSRDEVFEVKCYDGSVFVETAKVKPLLLEKGKGVKVIRESMEPVKTDLDSTSQHTWVQGEFTYLNVSLDQVFAEAERQFNVKISIEGFDEKSKFYTGGFNRGKLSESLDRICLPMGLSYSLNADSTRVTIKPN